MVGGQKVSITPMQQMARTEGGDLGSRQTHCHLQLNGCFSYAQQHLQKHSLPSSLDPHFVPFFVQSQPQFEDAPGHAPTAAAVAAVRSAKARARSEYVITATLRLNCDVMDSACATQTVHVNTKGKWMRVSADVHSQPAAKQTRQTSGRWRATVGRR